MLSMGCATSNSSCSVVFRSTKNVSFFFLILSLGQEKKLVEEVFNNAIDCLSDEDKTLPQVKDRNTSTFRNTLLLDRRS